MGSSRQFIKTKKGEYSVPKHSLFCVKAIFIRQIALFTLVAGILVFSGIIAYMKTTENETRIRITAKDSIPCNPNATDETKAVLRYLATLSDEPFKGAVSGQSCGHTKNIANIDDIMGFNQQAEKIFQITGRWPGIIALDYEHDAICTPQELSDANKILIKYWNNGGLVAVGFSPISPWLNDESDIEHNPGSWTDTRTINLTRRQKENIDLRKLTDHNEEMHKIWRRKLSRIADALQELEDAGVVVLFKTMQEQNGYWFWWGIESHRNDPLPYINLYRDIYTYFTEDRGLNNIIWLYSPNKPDSGFKLNFFSSQREKPQMWLYPGNDFVDIVAPTSYNDEGTISDYTEFVATGKPIGVAEYGPSIDGALGNFDNRNYINNINHRYPGMAFWICWHDWNNGDGTLTKVSISGNKFARELMNDPRVITRERLNWRK